MDLPVSKYDVTQRDLAKGRNLKIAAVSSPIVLTVVPAVIFLILMFVFGATPPVAATIFFLGLIVTALGFVTGVALTGIFAYRHSNWTKEMRERIAADGIKAEEIEWFRHELKSQEKRALRQLQSTDIMLADAYRETLASRLTATRIIRSSKHELQATRRREDKIKRLKTDRAKEFLAEIKKDSAKIGAINEEAKLMLAEAESRLQMIEAAAMRGSSLADSELALKKLSARAAELPLALEDAKMAEAIREEVASEIELESKEMVLPNPSGEN